MADNERKKAGDSAVLRHRDRAAALWAAELLGLINEAARDYVHDLTHGSETPKDDEGLIHRLARDLHGKASVHEIQAKLSHFLGEAKRQIFHDHGGDPA